MTPILCPGLGLERRRALFEAGTDARSPRLSEGISVLLKGGSENEAYPVGPAYLFVSTEDESRARVVIDAVNSGAYAITDADVDGAGGDEVAADAAAEGDAGGEA